MYSLRSLNVPQFGNTWVRVRVRLDIVKEIRQILGVVDHISWVDHILNRQQNFLKWSCLFCLEQKKFLKGFVCFTLSNLQVLIWYLKTVIRNKKRLKVDNEKSAVFSFLSKILHHICKGLVPFPEVHQIKGTFMTLLVQITFRKT